MVQLGPNLSPLPCPYRTVPFFSLTFEALVLTVRFLVFDREPYRTKKGIVIRLLFVTMNRTAQTGVGYSVYI
jgi:hypothetical protein